MRARGLKRANLTEICYLHLSRPMRARGLKPRCGRHNHRGSASRPMRARGLKLLATSLPPDLHQVAPHAGAWIETTAV